MGSISVCPKNGMAACIDPDLFSLSLSVRLCVSVSLSVSVCLSLSVCLSVCLSVSLNYSPWKIKFSSSSSSPLALSKYFHGFSCSCMFITINRDSDIFYLFVYCLSCLNINRFFIIFYIYNCFSMFHLFSSLARTSC